MLGSMLGASSLPQSVIPFDGLTGSTKPNGGFPNGTAGGTPATTGASRPSDTIQKGKKMIPTLNEEQNQEIGPLFSVDPRMYGFEGSTTHTMRRELPRYLIRQTPIFKPVPMVQDPWDKENQEEMLKLEESITDVTTLWETLKKMRDKEREVMEEKGLVDKADQAKDLTEAIVFQGTCMDMCPIFERARRSVENNVVRYEKADPNDKKVDRFKALKVFARPAAAAAPPLPSDVRPPPVLVKTLDYIVESIVPLLPDCEAFLWDRMRSIRQDFTYQNYSGPEAIDCNERIVRIHLLVLHQMAKTDITFSVQQELEQLHKAIITLCEIYDEVRNHGGQSPNEAEFRAYALLSKIRDPEYDKMALDLPPELFNDDLMQLAITFRRILANSNHVERGVVVTENCMNLYDRFFQLIQSAKVPFLMASFLQVYLNEIRFYGFKALSLAVTKKGGNLPYQYFLEHFLFRDESDLEAFCKYYSIDFGDGKIILKSLTATSHLLPETQPLRKNWLHCVEEKLHNTDTSTLINERKPNVDTIPSNKKSLLDEVLSVQIGVPAPNATFSNHNLQFPSAGTSSFQFKPAVQTNLQFQPSKQNSVLHDFKVNSTGLTSNFTNNESKLVNSKDMLSEKEKQIAAEKVLLEQQQLKEREERAARELRETEAAKALAAKKKNDILETTAAQIFDKMIKGTVSDTVSDTVSAEVYRKNRKQQEIEDLSKGLLRSFIHEQLYFVHLEVQSDMYRRKHLLKETIKLWSSKYQKVKDIKALRKRKQDEAARLSKELGIGKRIQSLRSEPKKRRVGHGNATFDSSSFMKSGTSTYSTPLHLEENHFTTPIRSKSHLWAPLDLEKLYHQKLRMKFSDSISRDSKEEKIMLHLDIVLYSKNWNSVSGSWLLNKFDLAEKASNTIQSEGLCTTFTRLNNEYKTDILSNVNLVIFNTGVTDADIFDLDMKLQKDGERLIELICGVAFNTNYKFKVLIIYWESVENPKNSLELKHLLRLDRILKRFADIVYNIEFVKIVGSNPDQLLTEGIENAANDFEFELTDRGLYNETRQRRTLLGAGREELSLDREREPSADIDGKMKLMLDQERENSISEAREKSAYAHLKNHAMASPRGRYKKLPVLLSESHKPKYKTPVVSQSSRHGSVGSYEVSNPSHLLNKIKSHRAFVSGPNTSGHLGTPSQPRHLLNHKTMLTTPQLAGLSGNKTDSRSALDNLSGDSDYTTPTVTASSVAASRPAHSKEQPTIRSISSETLNTVLANSPQDPSEIPSSIRELQSLIATVKKNLGDSKE